MDCPMFNLLASRKKKACCPVPVMGQDTQAFLVIETNIGKTGVGTCQKQS